MLPWPTGRVHTMASTSPGCTGLGGGSWKPQQGRGMACGYLKMPLMGFNTRPAQGTGPFLVC